MQGLALPSKVFDDPRMQKLLLLPVLMGAACLLAGIYGAVHNQISYSVAPGYFHEFKFVQFRIPLEAQNRLGAGAVGIAASWWMGLVIGVPIYLVAIFAKYPRQTAQIFLKAALLVVAVTLAAGLAALIYGFATITLESLPTWMTGRRVSDPVAFARAGMMHNNSYLGGVIGLVAASVFAVRAVRRTRAGP